MRTMRATGGRLHDRPNAKEQTRTTVSVPGVIVSSPEVCVGHADPARGGTSMKDRLP